jgi:hypothetical protein
MIAHADEVVRGITLNVYLLTYCSSDENKAVVGGYGCHGVIREVLALVVGCALASLLGVEYEQYYIQKCLDIT